MLGGVAGFGAVFLNALYGRAAEARKGVEGLAIAEVNYDVNHDGVNDTAIVEHDDGTAQVFTDTDHDGVADQYVVLDDHGKVVDTATYDQASGQWVEAGGHGGDRHGGDQQSGSGGTIHADMPKGDVAVGPPTIDTDHDGKNDTAVVQTKDGGTIAFTGEYDGNTDVFTIPAAGGVPRRSQ